MTSLWIGRFPYWSSRVAFALRVVRLWLLTIVVTVSSVSLSCFVIPLPEEDKYCPYCNSKMEYVTETFVREELRITPAKVERIHYYQEKWQCPECKKDGDGTSAESKTPTALIPHSPASPSIVSYVAMEKIGLAMPYYRQEFLMNQLG